MSLYARLENRLAEQSDDAGAVRGTYSGRRMLMIWLAANLVVTTLLTGTLFVPDVPYGLVLALIVGGTVLGAAVLVLIGAIGTRTGLPTMALTRGPFGTRGSLLPVAANVVILMGWSWVQAMLAGDASIACKDACALRASQDHAGRLHSASFATELALNAAAGETASAALGSVALDAHLDSSGALDLDALRRTVRTAVRVLDNNWTVVTVDGSLSAHYENTIAITDGEPEILTMAEDL